MADETKEDFASLLAEYEGKSAGRRKREPNVGDLVRGRVVAIGREAVFVELGGKSDGAIDIAEVSDAEGRVTVAVGDEIEAHVVEVGGPSGSIVLRRMLGRGPDALAELEQAFAHGIPVEGVVNGVNKGGVEVQVAGVRAFCPISQLELRHVDDASVYVGQRLSFRITRLESSPRANVVLSRRALLEEEARALAVETRARLAVGAVIKGRVSALKDYGAFVDLGGVEGMLHISELGFQRVGHPKDVLSVGQEIEVQILRIEASDDRKRPEKIALSLKSLERDPWSDAGTRFPEGTRANGVVARVESFGAFVELAPGVEGLLHISQLASDRPVRHAREAAKVGERLAVTVLSIDLANRRIALAPSRPDDDYTPAPPSTPSPKLGTLGDLFTKAKKRR